MSERKRVDPESVSLVEAAFSQLPTELCRKIVRMCNLSTEHILSFGSQGTGNGQFDYPCKICIQDGEVYMIDAPNHRIQAFSTDGKFLRVWGSQGTGDGQFNYPYAVAVDANGSVFIADTYNHRIQVFGSDGTCDREWGSNSTGDGQFSNPRGIAVSEGGSVAVVD